MHHMVGKATWGMRWGVLAVAGTLLVGGCSGTTAETTTTVATTTSTSTTSTTATTPPATTTTTTMLAPTTTVDPLARPDVLASNVNRDTIDDFDTSGDNLYLVAMELKDLFVYVEGNPTTDADEMVSLMYEPSYPGWNSIMLGFLELTDNPGWSYTDPGTQTLGIQVVSVDGDTAIVNVADQRIEQVISTPEGEIVRTYDGWERRLTAVTLTRRADGQWRIASAEPLDAPTDADVASMVAVEWTGRRP
jgi:hypothetical protein